MRVVFRSWVHGQVRRPSKRIARPSGFRPLSGAVAKLAKLAQKGPPFDLPAGIAFGFELLPNSAYASMLTGAGENKSAFKCGWPVGHSDAPSCGAALRDDQSDPQIAGLAYRVGKAPYIARAKWRPRLRFHGAPVGTSEVFGSVSKSGRQAAIAMAKIIASLTWACQRFSVA